MYCPATILSHCLLENTLKIHLLRIVWIWDFPEPTGLVQLLEAGSFHLVWRRRRWEAGAGAGVPASHPSTRSLL